MRFSCLTIGDSYLFRCPEVSAQPQAAVLLQHICQSHADISENQEHVQLHIYLCLELWIVHVHILLLYLQLCLSSLPSQRQGCVVLIISEANRESFFNQSLCLTISIIRLTIFWRHSINPVMHVCVASDILVFIFCNKLIFFVVVVVFCVCVCVFVLFLFLSPFHRGLTDWWSPKAYTTNYTASIESAYVLSWSGIMLVLLRYSTSTPQRWWTV